MVAESAGTSIETGTLEEEIVKQIRAEQESSHLATGNNIAAIFLFLKVCI